MSSPSNREVEIKLRLRNAAEGRRRLRQVGFQAVTRREFEHNVLFDTPGRDLRSRDSLLRLRTSGKRHVLTFKGPSEPGKHKMRDEIEVELSGREAFEEILRRLGMEPAYRYEKYRTEYAQEDGGGRAMLDETPIGAFLELEGPPEWIDRTAAALEFTEADYITATYAELGVQASGGAQRDMLFDVVP